MAQYDVNWSAPVALAAGTILAGQCVVPDSTGAYYAGTTANRALYGRCDGVAVSAGDSRIPIAFITTGPVDNAFTGLGAGLASWVRVSTLGVLERVTTPSVGDDVVGWCETTGRMHAMFGLLTAAIVNGGGASTPTGTGLPHIVAGVQSAAASLVVNADVSASAAIAASKVVQATGTGIPHVVAGVLSAASSLIVDADVTSVGVAKLTGLGTNVATLLTSVLAAGYTTFAVTPSGANLASLLTSALPVSKGGTGVTTSTGSGALVLGTAPTISAPILTGTSVVTAMRYTASTTNAGAATINDVSLGGNRVLRLTGAAPFVTGFDATGVGDLELLYVIAIGGIVQFDHLNGASLAANQLSLPNNALAAMRINGVAAFMYDATSTKWRMLTTFPTF